MILRSLFLCCVITKFIATSRMTGIPTQEKKTINRGKKTTSFSLIPPQKRPPSLTRQGKCWVKYWEERDACKGLVAAGPGRECCAGMWGAPASTCDASSGPGKRRGEGCQWMSFLYWMGRHYGSPFHTMQIPPASLLSPTPNGPVNTPSKEQNKPYHSAQYKSPEPTLTVCHDSLVPRWG